MPPLPDQIQQRPGHPPVARSLADSHWTQIDRSVSTALRKHPRLARYVVCLPMDLPDARVPGQESALAKWYAVVSKNTNALPSP